MEKNTEQKNNILHVGLDVGSTTVKIIVMDSNLNTIYEDYQRHFSDTKNTVCNVLENLIKKYPENEKLKKIIPDNTKVLKSYTEKDCLVLDFSSDILSYDKEDKNTKQNLINSIVYTMTQFTEINSVKILVEGEEKEEFKI